ncbi:Ger(x)C family spore germination protein [Halobacillus seohaensis]|uniref:Ger(X)C family spore germination protein n=1 Tax=Halobacillus seohaensis TaxID=447421 RepID=A0ABW2ELZ4_9BACI
MIRIFSLLWLLSLILLAGCWDQNELEEVALVMGMGIDKTEDDLYHVSFQVVNPGQVTGGEMTKGGEGTAVTTYSEKGKTLFETVRKISKKVPRNLSFSHMVVLIISEDLVKEQGLLEVMDFTERYYGFRSTALVLLARDGKAEPILSILNPLERIPAMKIQETLIQTAEVWGENPEQNINDVIRTLSNKSKGGSLNGITLVGNKEEGQKTSKNQQAVPTTFVEINGVALLKDGKLESWMDDKEARGVSWVQNEIQKTVVTAQCEKNEQEMAVEVRQSNTKLKATMSQGKPEITLNIRAEGPLEEVACPIDLTKPEVIFDLNNKFASAIKQEVTKSIKLAQEQKNDVFGFGDAVNRSHPKEWKKIEGEWPDTFADMNVQVNVEFFIRGTGLRTKPLILDKK